MCEEMAFEVPTRLVRWTASVHADAVGDVTPRGGTLSDNLEQLTNHESKVSRDRIRLLDPWHLLLGHLVSIQNDSLVRIGQYSMPGDVPVAGGGMQ